MRGTTVAGRYRLTEPIGSGGMGTVWRAEDLHESHDAALKIIPVGEGDPVREAAFRREAQVAARLSHPNVVAVRDHGAADLDGCRILFLAMDLVGGRPLNTLTGRPLPIPQALTWAIHISQALEAAHHHGIVHRDLKPSNILLDEAAGGTARLCDFGIARLADATHHTLTVTGVAIGTPAYMSPEQARGDTTLGAPSDLYSLGCLLHELLAGSVPFTGTGWQVLNQHLNTAPAPLSTLRPGVPRELEQLVLELLDKDPDRRPTAVDTRARLTQLHAALAVADAPTAVPTQRLPTPTLVAAVPDTAAQDCSSPRAGRTALYAGAVTAAAIAGELSLTTALPNTWSVALGGAAGLLLAGSYCLDPPRPHAAQELRITTAGLLTMLILTGGAVLATLIAAPSLWGAALALAFMGGPALVGCATGVRRLIEGALRRRTGWSADLAATAGALHTTTLLLAAHHAGLSALALVGVGVVLWPAAALLTAVVTPGRTRHVAADSVEGERTAQIGRAPSGRPQSAVAA
ncbi:serine/threonine-protein kinase [Streptomyces sp. GC420]|uniref:serine/threonine-protein kinase n=1 Tax=Streptomyces sp. GC420 TaxID=2697568 RepID=UPI00141507F3|nr:serine/threonine-protein kinase [Streptomyces sp. GC420]NBM19773.1 protein kinase [Streptomyces sp. GC420]